MGEREIQFGPNVTTKDFPSADGTSKERLKIIIVNVDQQFGDTFGGFMRLFHQDDAAAVTYDTGLMGGMNVSGKAWGRTNDNAAIAYGYLYGGNRDIDNTHVAEAYVRFALHTYLGLTLDVQYMRDNYKAGNDIKGFIYGIRAVASF